MTEVGSKDHLGISPEEMARVFPPTMLQGLRSIEANVHRTLPDVEGPDRTLCVALAVASWVLQLDKAGQLDMAPRDVAYIYQAGRIAAQELDVLLSARLQPVIDSMGHAHEMSGTTTMQ
jgi:hypothetical protein